MFDWARGSLLKKMIEHRLFSADWDPVNTPWLKNWQSAWMLGLLEFTPGMRLLDVGSSTPVMADHLRQRFGCEAHALDVDATAARVAHFGFSAQATSPYPNVQLHFGLAGDEVLPAEHFDFIMCISAIEHTYDQHPALSPERPLAHLNALRDMVRMLKPGGVLMMNWDMYLSGTSNYTGWEHETDYALLKHCGLRLVSNRRKVRGKQYLFDHADSLFFGADALLALGAPSYVRATSINMLWRKPGTATQVKFAPHPALEPYYFPRTEESGLPAATDEKALTTDAIDARFRNYIEKVTQTLTHKPRARIPVAASAS